MINTRPASPNSAHHDVKAATAMIISVARATSIR